MTDQQRFDTIAGLGNQQIHTPNLDRLVRRGLTFSRAYATCPVCVAARYTIRTGCEPPTTRIFSNSSATPARGQAAKIQERCGPYLGRVMSTLGYRTFGIGKFHTSPWNEDLGFERMLRSEEGYSPTTRLGDSYAAWLAREHPEFDFVEQLMGERTEMYYIPQRSPLPAHLGVEAWAAERAIEQIETHTDERPYFGFISFVGPHPPLAPPVPYNRMYDPDRMPDPVLGQVEQDYMDEELPYMRYAVWADAINPALARIVKARYYGEISYIDSCLGKILDCVEATPRPDNTLICFFSDHGDLRGDHHGWQKQNFFEGSCRIPFLLSWPTHLPANESRHEIVSLADLFGIATQAAGGCELRQGVDLLGILRGECAPRAFLTGMAEIPGSAFFKVMILSGEWKYIFMANGGREQLFNLKMDPDELHNCITEHSDVRDELYQLAVASCNCPGAADALTGGDLRTFAFRERPRERIYQFDKSRGVVGFPERPAEVVATQPLAKAPHSLPQEHIPEKEDLGLGLRPGDKHYRAYVGPPERYDHIAAMTFNLLTTLGLRQEHTLLDIGCGSLRVGRLFIPYLNQGNYFGVEPNEWLVQAGIRCEVGEDLIRIKRPKFFFTDSPAILKEIGPVLNFAVAQSIFSHCGPDLIPPWLEAVANVLRRDGALAATFLIGDTDNAKAGWIYPDCVRYRAETLSAMAADAHLRFKPLDWRHPAQTWALFAAPGFDTSWFDDKPLNWNTAPTNLAKK
jgi:choline-sulfatase